VETTTRTDTNLTLARQIFTWFAEGEMDAFLGVLHVDVTARPAIDGAPVLEGRDAVSEWWAEFASSDADLEVRPLDFEARGNCVIVRGYLRQRTGRTLSESEVHWLYELRDGQVIRMESHPTRKSALAAC
jgi:ketosteroid isomerase-like protein